MSERSKYSLNGVYRCESFARYVQDDSFLMHHIGYASGFFWSIQFRTEIEDGSTVAYPFIFHHDKRRTQVSAYFNILKKDGSSSFETFSDFLYLKSSEGCIGKYMDVEELLDEENGYLNEGALIVEYGLQVESIEGTDGIWMFNFFDPFFNWQFQDDMFYFTREYGKPLFGHKHIVKLHSKKVSEFKKDRVQVPNSISVEKLVMCLQISHGVRLQMTAKEIESTIEVAFHFGFSNTVRYCEQQLIEIDEQLELKIIRKFEMAVKFNMERYMIHLLIHIGSLEQLIDILKILDLEKMSSESMKAFVIKFLFLG